MSMYFTIYLFNENDEFEEEFNLQEDNSFINDLLVSGKVDFIKNFDLKNILTQQEWETIRLLQADEDGEHFQSSINMSNEFLRIFEKIDMFLYPKRGEILVNIITEIDNRISQSIYHSDLYSCLRLFSCIDGIIVLLKFAKLKSSKIRLASGWW